MLRRARGRAVAAPPPAIGRRAHELTYRIVGEDVQFVEIELDPGEATVAEAGGMMYMTAGVQMDTVFGDGSQQQQSGIMGALMGAGKRLLTGESLFTTVFSNPTASLQKVAFAAPYPGRILPMDLKELGGELICQKDSFLAAAKGVSIGIAFQKKIGVGLFGGEGFIMQRLTGDGLTFVHAGGMIEAIDLKAGEIAQGRYRLPGRADAVGAVRRAVCRQGEDRVLRRRGPVLRRGHRSRPRVAAVAAPQPHGRPHPQGRARHRARRQGRRLHPRRASAA